MSRAVSVSIKCMQTQETAIVSPARREGIVLDVGGMKCAGCVRAVEQQLAQQPGVISATVNLVTEVAAVECERGAVDATVLASKLTDLGFPTQPRSPHAKQQSADADASFSNRQSTAQPFRQTAIAAALLVFSAIGHLDHFGWVIPGFGNIWFHWGLATLALIGPGHSIFRDGWRGLRHNVPNMNTLIGMGTLTAYTASVVALLFPQLGWECFFDEPVMLVGFILLGRSLEQQARSRAIAAFQSLLTLQPAKARLIASAAPDAADSQAIPAAHCAAADYAAADYVEVPASQIRVGEWVQVLPSDKIPVDGEIVVGQTTVNESMLTGESLPVVKQPGDFVAAGTLNQAGAIVLKATRTGRDTTLAQIIALVEAAQTRKAPIQQLADTIAGYFTYGVMTLALLTFLFWYFIGVPLWHDTVLGAGHQVIVGGHMMHSLCTDATCHTPTGASPLLLSLKLAITVLVIACPCALGLATPTAILVGSGIGAEQGLLIRGGDVLEKVHHLNVVVFDKTGTLTTGQPIVTDCLACQESESDLLQFAATVESGTRHPLAQAILQRAQQQNLPLLPATEFYTEPGLGVSASVSGRTVFLGSQDWLNQQGIEIDGATHTQAQVWAAAGKTIVYLAIDHQLAGLFAVQDTLRPDAQETVSGLRQMGLRVMMVTGDQPLAANPIAQSLGFEAKDVLSGVRPADKAAAIAKIQQQGQRVAMVGDGINDAPALAQADVSISLHSGTEVAIETAEIVLMRDRLSDILRSIWLSRATFNKIRQNLFWAFAYNVLGIPIAAGVLLPTLGFVLNPAAAGAFMAFSSVSVVTNSLLLRRMLANSRMAGASPSPLSHLPLC